MTPALEIELVCMPFGNVFSPSLALSLLKAGLAAQGMGAQVRYFSLRFAEIVGQHFYYGLASESRPSIEHLAGEWVFARALFGPGARDDEYVERILGGRTWGGDDSDPVSPALVRRILRARERADEFLHWCLESILRSRPRLLGFTSMFQQHVASLALARLVKEALPETVIVFGGANCAGVMGAETLRQFPFVDAVVPGEGDLVFPDLARRVLEGRELSGLPGVRTRGEAAAEFARGRFAPDPMVRNLDELPFPDHDDYFRQFEASRFGPDWQPSVFFETSRGCWWGERMHCTFCGLNAQTMAFRSKSAPRALQELARLTERHPGCAIQMTDNILDMAYFDDFLPRLAARSSPHRLFYEVKANLRKDQLATLRAAGVTRIQPGIESFSDPVLRLMRKGVTALQNIQLLKWCKELGVEPRWNLLWGFPGEPPEEYERMARLVPLLSHLSPPDDYGFIRLDRFSPNFFDAERLGFTEVAPLASYEYVYPFPRETIENLAYFFTFGYRDARDVDGYVARLARELGRWQRLRGKSDLFSVDLDDRLLLWDLRPASRAWLTTLQGAERLLYRACDRAQDLRQLAAQLERSGAGPHGPDQVEALLEPLREKGVLLREGSRYLALALPLGAYSPPDPVVARFYELARTLGTRVSEGWLVGGAAGASPHGRAVSASAGKRPPRPRRRALSPSCFSINDRGEVLISRISGPNGRQRGGANGKEEDDRQAQEGEGAGPDPQAGKEEDEALTGPAVSGTRG